MKALGGTPNFSAMVSFKPASAGPDKKMIGTSIRTFGTIQRSISRFPNLMAAR
jgi:hypothetical protein